MSFGFSYRKNAAVIDAELNREVSILADGICLQGKIRADTVLCDQRSNEHHSWESGYNDEQNECKVPEIEDIKDRAY